MLLSLENGGTFDGGAGMRDVIDINGNASHGGSRSRGGGSARDVKRAEENRSTETGKAVVIDVCDDEEEAVAVAGKKGKDEPEEMTLEEIRQARLKRFAASN